MLRVTVLSVSDLSLSFGDHAVLSDVSFSLNEGDRLGVIGVNGAGKTTLFRVITGEYKQDSGSVFISKDKTVGILRQDVAVMCEGSDATLVSYILDAFPELLSLEKEISETENALPLAKTEEEAASLLSRLNRLSEEYAALGGLEYRGRSRATLLRMGFKEEDLSRPVTSLSGGQHTRLALSRLLTREPDILMLDEPTNHLDIDALLWLEEFLRGYKKTVILISHDRYFLDRVTTKTLSLRKGHARLFPGNYTRFKEAEAMEAASQEKKYKEQQKVIARIEKNIQFQRECGMEHNFVTIRAKEKQLARMEKVEAVAKPEKEIRVAFHSEASTSEEVVSLENLSFSYGEKKIFSSLSFLVRKGERVLFLGKNGCGKSTLLRLITGALRQNSGKLRLGYNISVGYYDQENRFEDESRTVFEELRESYPTKTDFELRSCLALFLFGENEITRPISALSGGERARVTLAKMILKKINLLVLDEPTNHLDIASREALENAVSAFDGTVIAVSHDRYFIDRIATRIIELDDSSAGGVKSYEIGENEGGYTAYLSLREKIKTDEPSVAAPTKQKLAYEEKKQAMREERALEKRREKAKEKAASLEKEMEALEEELYGSAAADYVRAAEIDARRTAIEEELLSLYELFL